jgi:hypothetical protein
MRRSIKENISGVFIRLFPLVVIFTGSLYNPADADLGWHLKYGEYFLTHGRILMENLFSSTMIYFHWINHSWMTDVITYAIFRSYGFYGLTIVGALTVTLAFACFSRSARLTLWEKAIFVPLMINIMEPLTMISLRSHLISLSLLGILWYLLKKYSEGSQRILILTIPLFAFWSNIHGEFILGLALFGLWTLIQTFITLYPTRKRTRSDIFQASKGILVYIGCTIAPIINPFGPWVYWETLKHFGNPLQKFIIEWLPLDTYSPTWWKLVGWGILLSGSIYILYKQKKLRQELPFVLPVVVMFGLSFWMRRYAWPMFLLSIPVTRTVVSMIKPMKISLSIWVASSILFVTYFYVVLVQNPGKGISSMNWDAYCRRYLGCSTASATYLSNHLPSGKLLTFYNWGGWLIWNYPSIKPSIDGRMTLWRDEKGYSAFEEYYSWEQGWKDPDLSEYDAVYFTPDKPLYPLMMKHVTSGTWRIEYQDARATLFVRAYPRAILGPTKTH